MTYFIEIRRTVERAGPISYIPLTDAANVTGFRSVFAVDETTRDIVLQARSSSALRDMPVYADTLFIDFDAADGTHEIGAMLTAAGTGFEAWSTGRRGLHFHIPIEPMFGTQVPASHLAWVQQNVGGAWDKTIYRAASVIRLPGTWHEKAPGRRKELFFKQAGERLVVPMLTAPAPIEQHDVRGERNVAEFWSAILAPAYEPGRTFRLWHLAKLAAECGVARAEALDALHDWAAMSSRPALTNTREIQRVFQNGYK